MIKKIKKYKLSLRPSYVARNLKKKLPQEAWRDEIEGDIQREIARLEPRLAPSSVYESFSQAESPSLLKELWNKSPKGAISISIIATTIGSDIEKEIEDLRNGNDEVKAALVGSIAQEALEQSTHFVCKLLAEESKEEHCECTPSLPLDASFLKDSLGILQSERADIRLTDGGQVTPLYSSVSYCFWNPAKKR